MASARPIPSTGRLFDFCGHKRCLLACTHFSSFFEVCGPALQPNFCTLGVHQASGVGSVALWCHPPCGILRRSLAEGTVNEGSAGECIPDYSDVAEDLGES